MEEISLTIILSYYLSVAECRARHMADRREGPVVRHLMRAVMRGSLPRDGAITGWRGAPVQKAKRAVSYSHAGDATRKAGSDVSRPPICPRPRKPATAEVHECILCSIDQADRGPSFTCAMNDFAKCVGDATG